MQKLTKSLRLRKFFFDIYIRARNRDYMEMNYMQDMQG
jgi:hypothetical protein